MVGKTLLHYRIVARLGKGGMGEVWLAEDSKLGRRVALKALPPEMAADAERRARFEREARAVAALNHPNIVTLHSVEEAGGLHFLTMELVEGKTLSEIIPAGGMELPRLLDLAIPIADALAAAHGHGILHRDLKPDNIMIGADSRPKILDFGLAKLREGAADAPEAATQLPTRPVTADGHILGTVAYMSPEQAEGRPTDARSDLFSLGIILYEMATGARPFQGETTLSTLTSILRDEPRPVNERSPHLPRHLGRIVRRCLAKESSRRIQTALDVRNELEELSTEVASGPAGGSGPSAAGARPARLPWIVAGALGVALMAVLAWTLLRPAGITGPSALEPFHASLSPLTDVGVAVEPDLSPDGRMLLYVTDSGEGSDILLQRVGGEKPINLTADFAGDDHSPAFSPDGERIAFVSKREGGGIFIMGATGESPRRLVGEGYHPSWSPGGDEILYTTERVTDPYNRWTTSELHAVEVDSGEGRLLFEGDAAEARWSPDGSRIAFWANNDGQRDIWTLSTAGGDPVAVTGDRHTDWGPVWSPDGRYLYFLSDRGGSPDLWRVRIDPGTGLALASPQAVTSGISRVLETTISGDGRRIAYAAGNVSGELIRLPFDPQTLRPGEEEVIYRTANLLDEFDVSPDGGSIVLTTTAPQEDVYVIGTDGTGRRQLTNDPHRDRGVRFSPEGRIYLYSNRNGRYDIWTLNPDGTDLRSITSHLDRSLNDPAPSPDGRYLMCNDTTEVATAIILDLEAPGAPTVTQRLAEDFFGTGWGPDGQSLTGGIFGSGHGGYQVATLSLPSGEIRVIRDASGDGIPGAGIWTEDGRRLIINDEARRRLLVWDPETGGIREIPGVDAGGHYHFALFPSGDALLLQRVRRQSDIWLLTLEGQR